MAGVRQWIALEGQMCTPNEDRRRRANGRFIIVSFLSLCVRLLLSFIANYKAQVRVPVTCYVIW